MSTPGPLKPFKELIAEGRVCQPHFFVMANELEDISSASPLVQYARHCPGKKAIVFCVSIEHAEDVAYLFQANGTSAVTILSNQNQAERTANIERFRSGDLKVLVTVGVLLNARWPEVDAVIIVNPTRSRTKFFQQVSVGLVPRFREGHRTLTSDERRSAIAASDKPHATIIDLAGNVLRLCIEGF